MTVTALNVHLHKNVSAIEWDFFTVENNDFQERKHLKQDKRPDHFY